MAKNGQVRGHSPVIIEDFNGLWSRGDDESCPLDHMLLANNVQFIHSGIETRQAAAPYSTILLQPVNDLQRMVRVYNYTTEKWGQTFLVLTEGGKIYHIIDADRIYLILTIPEMKDFAFIQIAGRAYISPFHTLTAPTGETYQLGLLTTVPAGNGVLWVYYRPPDTPNGTTVVARKAAGGPPTISGGGFQEYNRSFVAYVSKTEGKVTKGIHNIAMAYTFIGPVASKIGPVGPAFPSTILIEVIDAPGDKAIEVTGIPVGPVGTSDRKLLMTKAGEVTPYYVVTTLPNLPSENDRIFTIKVADADLTTVYVAGGSDDVVILGLSVQNTSNEGFCDLGFHLVGIVYETDTGYLSPPGPQYYAGQTYINENRALQIFNVPIGPAGTVKRHIVSTKTIPEYNGDQKGYQFYFVPKGTLENNTATTMQFSYYDSDLVADASHLLDNFTTIPAGVDLSEYHSRLVIVGDPHFPKNSVGVEDTTKPDNRSVAWVSAPGEPEAIDQIDGLIITPLDGNPLTHSQDFRDVLYLFKQNRTYSVVDNEDEPTTWGPVEVVDQGIGCPVHGIAEVLDSGGVNVDHLIVVNNSGLMLFNGTYARPELSWKIENIWTFFDKNKFHEFQIVNDSIRKIFWMTYPGDNSLLFMADYKNGLNPKDIRWALWNFDFPIIKSIVLYKVDKLVLGTRIDEDGIAFFNNLLMIRTKSVWPPVDNDGYPSNITPPPYNGFPGVDGGPWIPGGLGGGLIMLDPDNTAKHDVFLDGGGSTHSFPIKVQIRTAFIGG